MTVAVTTRRIKLIVVATVIASALSLLLTSLDHRVEGQVAPLGTITSDNEPASPDSLIDSLDKTIQHRFLTAPNFGFARIAPVTPVGPKSRHMSSFNPNTPDEYAAVTALENDGWDAGIYLFGRRVEPRVGSKKANQYDIRYRLFDPIAVTKGLKRSNFRKQKKLAAEMKRAFLEFQDPNSANFNELKFEVGEWSYVARPVRAAQQSCLECHKDYVITDKLAEGKFTARPRRIGDVNGVLFYALRKRDGKL